jgi:hypothetical protein
MANNRSHYNKEYHLKHRFAILKRKRESYDKLKRHIRYKEYKKESLAYQRIYRKSLGKKAREKLKLARIYTRYKITPEEYKNLCIKQKYRCVICHKKVPLCVDHNHKTGAVRGLICRHCNALLGHAFDKVAVLRTAIQYLITN